MQAVDIKSLKIITQKAKRHINENEKLIVQMQFRAPELVILSGILSAACSQRKDI
jgi:hypothetical protein